VVFSFYLQGKVMAFGHLLACESKINLAWAIFTVFNKRGNCPVVAANKVMVTAIEINFDRPIGFVPFPLLSVPQG
jgi:hypothetical protein